MEKEKIKQQQQDRLRKIYDFQLTFFTDWVINHDAHSPSSLSNTRHLNWHTHKNQFSYFISISLSMPLHSHETIRNITKSANWTRMLGRQYCKPDVLVWKLCSCNQGFIRVAKLVMNLISFSKTSQDLYGLINSRFWHFYGLESSFQCWVFLNVLPVFI